MQVRQTLKRFGASIATGAGVLLVAVQPAHAAFTVPPEVAQAGADAAVLGLAVLGVLVGIRAFKWIRKAM